jgi:hypothetical protein
MKCLSQGLRSRWVAFFLREFAVLACSSEVASDAADCIASDCTSYEPSTQTTALPENAHARKTSGKTWIRLFSFGHEWACDDYDGV